MENSKPFYEIQLDSEVLTNKNGQDITFYANYLDYIKYRMEDPNPDYSNEKRRMWLELFIEGLEQFSLLTYDELKEYVNSKILTLEYEL